MQAVEPIRRATVDDVEAITAVVNEAYSPYIARIGKPPAPMLDDYRQVLEQAQVHVATQDGHVVGVLVTDQEDHDLWLLNIAVLARCKGQGLGKRLMAFCEAQARAAGCSAIKLYTHEKMTENLDIYTRLGFVETHRAVQSGFARVFMYKPLVASGT
ncbi:GNAT family N-acetyltransferase [Pseudomonas sp. NPDC089554]|uniref:GNAT family N-acetyltransferase n=1 Tax=Pseudomonas sp. NPDC089554 TaxID=3390653 RepID=UPI003CFC500F